MEKKKMRKKRVVDPLVRRQKLVNALIAVTILLVLIVIWVLIRYFELTGSAWNIIRSILLVIIAAPFAAFVGAIVMAPLMRIFTKAKMSQKSAAALCTLLFSLAVFGVIAAAVWAIVAAVGQINEAVINDFLIWLQGIPIVRDMVPYDATQLFELIMQFGDGLMSFAPSFVSSITNLGLVLALFPVFLFYILKDNNIVKDAFRKAVPERFKVHYDALIGRFISVNTSYVSGTFYESCIMFLMTLAIYYILGGVMYFIPGVSPGAFLTWAPVLFAAIVAITNIVPFIGPFIGAIPPLIYSAVLFIPSAWWVPIVVLIIHLVINLIIDAMLLKPWLFGKAIKVHPLVVMAGTMLSGILFGIWGIIFSIVIIGFAKEFVVYGYELWKERRKLADEQAKASEEPSESTIQSITGILFETKSEAEKAKEKVEEEKSDTQTAEVENDTQAAEAEVSDSHTTGDE